MLTINEQIPRRSNSGVSTRARVYGTTADSGFEKTSNC
jgi:hypothetical protein